MKNISTLIIVFLLSAPSWAEPSTAANNYIQPYPHSSGADLLPYCEKTDEVVSQLRCDYYVQGVADLASIPQQGKPMACIPQGQNRTQLMQIAVTYLKTVKPDTLAKESAARLILNAFIAAFPCPKEEVSDTSKNKETGAMSKEMVEAIKKAMLEANKKGGGKVPD
jgi:hypothetical protein